MTASLGFGRPNNFGLLHLISGWAKTSGMVGLAWVTHWNAARAVRTQSRRSSTTWIRQERARQVDGGARRIATRRGGMATWRGGPACYSRLVVSGLSNGGMEADTERVLVLALRLV
jgi:hypothetical protein